MSQIFRTLQSNIYGEQSSGDSGIFTTVNTSATDVTNLTVTITTIGRPVCVALVATGASAAQIGLNNTSGATLNGIFKIVRDTSPSTGLVTVASYPLVSVFSGGHAHDVFCPASAVWRVDFGVKNLPNTYVYKVQANISVPAAGTARVENCTLIAFQIEA
jgi:hypothetical protein